MTADPDWLAEVRRLADSWEAASEANTATSAMDIALAARVTPLLAELDRVTALLNRSDDADALDALNYTRPTPGRQS